MAPGRNILAAVLVATKRPAATLTAVRPAFSPSGIKKAQGHLTFMRPQSTTSASIPHRATAVDLEEKNLIYSPYEDVQSPEVNFVDEVFRDVEMYKDNTAFVCGMSGREYTFEMLQAFAEKFGSALVRRGAQKGDVVGILMPNLPEFPICLYGVVGAGLVATPLNPLYNEEELARQLGMAEAKYLICIELFLEKALEAKKMCRSLKEIVVVGECSDGLPDGCVKFFDMAISDDGSLYKAFRNELNAKEDVAILPFSSGTYGKPKGVQLTHHNVVTSLLQCNHKDLTLGDPFGHETTVAVLPFFHIYGLQTIMNCATARGRKVVTMPRFDPHLFLENCEVHQPEWLNVVPTLLNFMATSPLVDTERHLKSIRELIGGAASFSQALIESYMVKVWPNNVSFRQGYGMTETTSASHLQPKAADLKMMDTVGVLMPNLVGKIVDVETCEALGPEKNGELWIKGPSVMRRYLNDEEATRQTVVNGGWLRTGDIASHDGNGHFKIVERLKDIIKVKGYQVSPVELEEILASHPKVAEVAVVGVPDEKMGEVPRAYVILKDGESVVGQTEEAEFMAFVNSKVASFKRLAGGVKFVSELPKNLIGKVLKKALQDQAKEEASALEGASSIKH